MSWEDEIDNLFKKEAENSKVEFKDEFWNEFEKMLPEKKNKKPFWIWISSGLGVVIGMLLLFTFNSNKRNMDISLNNTNQINEVQISKSIQKQETNKVNKIKENDIKTNNQKIRFINSKEKQNTINEEKKIKNTIELNESEINQENIIPSFINITNESLTNNQINVINEVIDQKENIDNIDLIKKNLSSDLNHSISPTIIALNPIRRNWNFNIELGVLAGQSVIRNNENGSNFIYGTSLNVNVNRNFGNYFFSTGLGVLNHNYSNLTINDRAKVYGFGVTNHELTMNYNKLYYTQIPIFLGYNFDKHCIQIGITTNYLTSTKMRYEYKINGDLNEKDVSWGNKKGLNSVVFQPSIKYAFKLNKNWNLGTTLSISSSVINEPKYFNIPIIEHPIIGQVFLRKNF